MGWWVLLFAAIAVGGLLVLGHVALRLWRSARALLDELDVMAGRAGELADLLSQVQVDANAISASYATSDPRPDGGSDDAWPGTVETYSDGGANAPGKKEP